MTEPCIDCGKILSDRDTAYAWKKFGNAVCYDHSAIGRQLGPRPEDNRGRFINGYIAGRVKRGISDEVAMQEATDMYARLNDRGETVGYTAPDGQEQGRTTPEVDQREDRGAHR